jgi:hypothetical protein
MIISLLVQTDVVRPRPAGTPVVLVAVQLSVPGLYLPPVLLPPPPQMIISLPVQTAMWPARAPGALVILVAVQLSVLGLYLPPVLKKPLPAPPPPDDHFAASPNCRVAGPGTGRVGSAGGCPDLAAACGTIRYRGKCIAGTRRCHSSQSPAQFDMCSLAIRYQTLRKYRPGQTLRDNKGIVP